MRPVFMILALLASALPVRAVIVQDGDGTQNQTSSGAGTGWDYVGALNGASGVYLGDYGGSYWVLTAAHVGAGTFTLGGVAYGAVPGSAISLSGDAPVDLTLFRIGADPGLTVLDLASSTPANGASLTMIGFGIGREATETRWTAGWVETESSNPLTAPHRGYKWSGPSLQRWGANTVTGTQTLTYTNGVTTEAIYTTFGTGRAQATTGDSGGGAFLADGSLAGIILAVSELSGQPVATSVYSNLLGSNATYMADISSYRAQILSAILPAPVPEPGLLALAVLGGAAMLAVRRCR